MARQREFDRDDVLKRAMHAFWTHGYEATTLHDLTDTMGIHRGSLYSAFASKHGLFVAALCRYDSVYREARTARIARSYTTRQAILATFEESIALAIEHGVRDGCLMVNTALELSPHDDEIAAIVARAFTGMEPTGWWYSPTTTGSTPSSPSAPPGPIGSTRRSAGCERWRIGCR